MFLPLLWCLSSPLDPDFDLEEAEKEEEEGDCQCPLQNFLAEEFLQPAAQHSSDEPANDDSNGDPQVGPIAIESIADKRPDTAEGSADQTHGHSDVHGKSTQGGHGRN